MGLRGFRAADLADDHAARAGPIRAARRRVGRAGVACGTWVIGLRRLDNAWHTCCLYADLRQGPQATKARAPHRDARG